MAKIQKFINTTSRALLVFTTSYSRSYEHIKSLIEELKKDFPDAKDSDIHIREFNNSHNNLIAVVVFDNKDKVPVPDTYQEASNDYLKLKY